MAAQPVTISRTEMMALLDAGKRKPEYTTEGGQLVATWAVHRNGQPTGVAVKVYTSVFGEVSRGVGEDSIRVCVVDPEAEKGLAKTTLTMRTVGWEGRLIGKITDMFKFAMAIPNCGRCGRRMAMRKRKSDGAPFWGCTGYATRECSATAPYLEEKE